MKKTLILIFVAFFSLEAFSIDTNALKTYLKARKYGNETIEVFRAKKGKIESPAKDSIFIVQNKLDDCYKLLKKKEDIANNLYKISATIQSIQKIDSNWPIHIYVSEIEFLQKHNTIEGQSFNTSLKTNKKKKTERTERDNAVPTSEQIEVSNKKDEDVEDSTCNMMSVSSQQTFPIIEQSASDTDIKENISEESDKSGKTKMGFIVIIAVLMLVAIRWIRSNMHLFFGGILVLLIFLIYGGVKNPAFFWGGAIIDIALWITYYLYTKRCPHCKKWGVMRKIGEEEDPNASYTKWRKEKFKSERKNNRTGTLYTKTHEEPVPVTVKVFHVYRKCKNCGYKDTQIVEKEQ